MKTNTKIVSGLVLVAVLVGALYFTGMIALPFAIAGCTDIFCNDYSFQCCGEAKTIEGGYFRIVYGLPPFYPAQSFLCEHERCVVTSGSTNRFSLNNNPVVGFPIEMDFGDVLQYPRSMDYPYMPIDADVYYDAYNLRLAWCGDAACDAGVTGIQVPGADGCSFVTNEAIYDDQGRLIREADPADQSYVLSKGDCRLIASGRHVCGNTCETCDTDSSCVAGHSFVHNSKGAECVMNQIELYGCVGYGVEPDDLDLLPGEEADYNYGHRCEVKQRIQVQCCPATATCGANAFCNPDTFICESTAECANDWDCGTGVVYDPNTKELKTPVCTEGQCDFSSETIGCYYNWECSPGWYCDDDYMCKQSIAPKIPCPDVCCVDDARYFDRSCPGDEVCCPGGDECADTLELCGGGGVDGDGNGDGILDKCPPIMGVFPDILCLFNLWFVSIASIIFTIVLIIIIIVILIVGLKVALWIRGSKR